MTANHEERTFASVPGSVSQARRFVVGALQSQGAAGPVVSAFELVVSELAANVVQHGDGTDLTVDVTFSDEPWWELDVVGGSLGRSDWAAGTRPWLIPQPTDPSGRGLGIVRELMDEVVTRTVGDQTHVTCRLRRGVAE